MLSSEGSREAARKEAAAKRALGEERATEQEGKAASQPASPLKGGAATQVVLSDLEPFREDMQPLARCPLTPT